MNFFIRLLIICLCVSGEALWAQKSETLLEESYARRVLAASNVSVDTQIIALLSLTSALEQVKLDSCLVLTDQALALIRRYGEEEFMGRAFRLRGNAHFYLGKYPIAIKAYKQSSQAYITQGEHRLAAYSIMAIGQSYARSGKVDSLLFYLQKTQPILKAHGGTDDMASLYNYFSQYYAIKGNLTKALLYTDSLIYAAEESGSIYRRATAYDQKGTFLLSLKKFDEGIEFLDKAYPLLDSLNYTGLSLENEFNQASYFAEIGMIDSAMHYYYKMIEKAENTKGYNEYISLAKGQISILFHSQGDKEKSQQYLSEALELVNTLDPSSQQFFFLEILEAMLDQEDQKGFDVIQKQIAARNFAFELPAELALRFLEAKYFYVFEQKYAEAISRFQSIMAVPDSIIKPFHSIEVEMGLAECYLELNQTNNTLKYLEKAERYLEEIPIPDYVTRINFLFVKAYRQTKNLQLARIYEMRYKEALTKSQGPKRYLGLKMAEARYQNSKLLERLELTTQSKEYTEKIASLIGGGMVLVLILLFFILRANQLQKKLTKEIIKERDRSNMLQGEVHHRVKNNLQQLSDLLKLQEVQTHDKAIKEALKSSYTRMEAMSLLHRRLYQNDDITRLNLRDYLESLTHDLLLAYGFNRQNAQIEFSLVDIDIDVDTGMSIGLIANEWITNALKYAFPKTPYLAILLELVDTANAHMIIADRGPGLPENFVLAETTSYGLQLVNMMADQIYGNVEMKTKDGTKCILNFPLNGSKTRVEIISE